MQNNPCKQTYGLYPLCTQDVRHGFFRVNQLVLFYHTNIIMSDCLLQLTVTTLYGHLCSHKKRRLNITQRPYRYPADSRRLKVSTVSVMIDTEHRHSLYVSFMTTSKKSFLGSSHTSQNDLIQRFQKEVMWSLFWHDLNTEREHGLRSVDKRARVSGAISTGSHERC